MWSSHRRTSSRRAGSICQTWSRPARAPRTRPTPPSTCRCFVTAWRVTPAPAVRRTIDIGPPVHSRATRPRRVSSPSAAKTGAAPARPPAPPAPVVAARLLAGRPACLGARRSRRSSAGSARATLRSPPPGSLARRGDILLDGLHLERPALPVHPIRLGAAGQRDLVEPGLYHGEHGRAGHLRELEDHECGGLGGVVDAGLHG